MSIHPIKNKVWHTEKIQFVFLPRNQLQVFISFEVKWTLISRVVHDLIERQKTLRTLYCADLN